MTHARNQDGFALIEVIVSAAVLALLALAVLAGIDGATASTARERARSQASTIAEADQERLRSLVYDTGMAAVAVPQQSDVTLDGVTYSVKSEAAWVTDDDGGEPKCGDKSYKQGEYLRITSTVTSNLVGARIPPVKIESLFAPDPDSAQTYGTLAVKVISGNLARAANTTVTAIGPQTYTAVTNQNGCALFRAIAIGDYKVSVNRNGYIDKQGNQYSETTATTSPNLVAVASFEYDKSVDMTVSIKTTKPGSTFSTTGLTAPSKAYGVADNAADASSLRAYAASPQALVDTIRPAKLFPFDNAYSYFTGSCAYQSPTKASTAWTNYFTDVNPAAAIKGDPGVFQPQTVTVYQPPLNLRVRADSVTLSSPTFDAAGKVTVQLTLPSPTTADKCSDVVNPRDMKVASWDTNVWGSLPAKPSNLSDKGWVWQNVTGLDPGMPFGKYKVCLYDTTKKVYWGGAYDNTSPSGPDTTVEVPPTGTKASDWGTKAVKCA